MKRIALLIFLSVPSYGAWDKGFNFRATSGFVTDGANTTYVLDTEAFPTVRNGVTFGWSSTTCIADQGGGGRDRDAGIDARLAGMNFIGNRDERCTFKVTLPAAGTYIITLGYGDAGANTKSNYIVIKDSGTTVLTLSNIATLATPTFGDAVGNTYNAATWPGSQTTTSKTFATTTFDLMIGSGATPDGTDASITHLFISQVGSSAFRGILATPGSNSIRTTAGSNSLRTIP